MRATWTFVAVLAAFAAVQAKFGVPALISTLPLTLSEESSLVDEAKAFLDTFRTMMKTGRADFNIRVLDPAVVEKVPIDAKHGPFKYVPVNTWFKMAGLAMGSSEVAQAA